MAITKNFDIFRYSNSEIKPFEDIVISEYTLSIYLNGRKFVNLICLYEDLELLVIGYLFSEGIISALDDIEALILDNQKAAIFVTLKNDDIFSIKDGETQAVRTLTTACGKQHSIAYGIFADAALTQCNSDVSFKASYILECANSFNRDSELFLKTGGVHSCALYNDNGLICYFEDIGRHNAFDKALGFALKNNLELSSCFLMTSGRVPTDMVVKCLNSRLPVLVSRSAPTDKAIELANKKGVTLIGFARGQRMNIYTHFNRVLS